ncbi:MAG TPA: UvrD-helicase domain-containing protein, partial [Solirubrobacteraceae bacterium]
MSTTMLGSSGRAFTAEQSEAIRAREGSLLLEANAGSGKTSVLVERFVRSVLEDGVRPSRILAITFTERAAGELRARVRGRFVELGRRDEA